MNFYRTSTGVGYDTELALARRGYVTYAGIKSQAQARKLSHIADIEKLSLQVLNLDVNSSSSVTSAVKRVVKNEGLIDLLVNGNDYIILGCFEDISIREMAALLWRHQNLTVGVTPHAESKKRGNNQH